jgi:hypothetical protein
MLDEIPKRFPIRCRWCAEGLMIDVPFDVKAQAGHAECSRGHVTRYHYDGVTVAIEERRWSARMPYPYGEVLRRSHADS